MNMALGWPPLKQTRSAPSNFSQMKSGSASRLVRKNPSISLICAKCLTLGVSPLPNVVNPWLNADCATWDRTVQQRLDGRFSGR